MRPDIPPEGLPRPDALSDNELREPLRTHALEAGLGSMKRSPITSYTLPSLEATEYAREQGKFQEFHKACYQVFWDEGRDLGDMKVLESVARDTGLDWPELEARLESQHYREQVLQQYVMGRQFGFQGIPAFIIGDVAFTGAVPYTVFQSAAQRAMPLLLETKPQTGEG